MGNHQRWARRMGWVLFLLPAVQSYGILDSASKDISIRNASAATTYLQAWEGETAGFRIRIGGG